MLAAVITVALAWYSLQVYRRFRAAEVKHALVHELKGKIIYFDEVLTMSARMAAATGDLKWEKRYRFFEPQLDAVIKEAVHFVPETLIRQAVNQTDSANIKLVAMENEAFDSIRRGKLEEATDLLRSAEYEQQKRQYTEGMEQLNTEIHNYMNNKLYESRQGFLYAAIFLIIVVFLIVFSWLAIFHMRRKLTERKLAEEALRESEAHFKAIYDNATDGILLAHAETKLFFKMNNTMMRMIGYSEEEIKGLAVKDIHPAEDLPYITNEFERQAKGEIEVAADIPVKRKDGSLFYADINSAPFALNGETYVLGIFRDISERKRAEDEQAQHQAELFQSQKLECVGLLAGGVAHDFNNLMQGIMGYVQLIKVKMDEDDENYAELNFIEVLGEKAAVLTQQLLSFARKGKYVVGSVEIDKVVIQVVALLKRTVNKNIIINLEVPDDISNIKADENQIHQVLLNLCINAKDAMPDGGSLTISAEEVNIDEVNISARSKAKPGRYVRLKIKDTGSGMDEETRAKIFEPFFTTKEVGKGTGLGLSMAHGVVENHGGFIEVESALGKGTEFQLCIPAIKAEKAEKVEPERSQPPEAIKFDDAKKDKRILVVDDEDIIRYLAVDMLTSLGYETLPAEDGLEAVEIFEKEKDAIDLVLLDLIMPNLGGAETFRRLKDIDPAIPIILISGYTQDEVSQELLDEGARGFIQKPYKFEALLKIIQTI